MAIFSLICKIIGNGKQQNGTTSFRSVVAAAAYRAGVQLKSVQEGVNYDYTRKNGVVHSEIIIPHGAPGRLLDREILWNEVSAVERRKDSQYCREIMIALPVELSQEENIRLARAYVKKTFVDKGMVADFSLHDPNTHSQYRNPHIHVMLTMRELTPDGKFGKKSRIWNDSDNVQRWRERWTLVCNKWLERGGFEQRIDHRSYKEQGVDKVPTVHLGTSASALERKGIKTAKGNINRAITAHNVAKECGIEEPTILANIARQWQGVRELRGAVGNSRSSSRKGRTDSSLSKGTDTVRTGVQRRTYTLRCNVVQQGQTPAPHEVEKYALQGDKNTSFKKKSIAQRLDELRRQEEKVTLEGKALRQPVNDSMTPALQQAATHLSFVQWLKVLLHGKQKQSEKPSEAHSSMYNIKAMASTLNLLSENGIGSYRQLEEKLNLLENQCMDITVKLEKGDKAIDLQQWLIGAALNCQANRNFAEQYTSKILFKDNYFKKYQKQIEAFAKGREQLRSVGLTDDVTPSQLRERLEQLKKQRGILFEELRQVQYEHERWIKIQERVKNVLSVNPTKSNFRKMVQKQKSPYRDGMER